MRIDSAATRQRTALGGACPSWHETAMDIGAADAGSAAQALVASNGFGGTAGLAKANSIYMFAQAPILPKRVGYIECDMC